VSKSSFDILTDGIDKLLDGVLIRKKLKKSELDLLELLVDSSNWPRLLKKDCISKKRKDKLFEIWVDVTDIVTKICGKCPGQIAIDKYNQLKRKGGASGSKD
jgi:hypothetical protein